jgi:hypothetical protein
MQHFLQLASGLNVIPALHALACQPTLWNANGLRTSFDQSPHREADDIWLWFNELKPNAAEVVNDLDVRPYDAWAALPQLRPFVFGLMTQTEGVRLGRVMVTRLRPGKRILPHVDGGAPAEYFQRYQVALKSLPGALFRIEDEVVNFASGDVWKINNRATHSVENNSEDDRIVLIVDIRHG